MTHYRIYIRFIEGHGRWGSGAGYTSREDALAAAEAETAHWSENTRIEVWKQNPTKRLASLMGTLPRLPHADE